MIATVSLNPSIDIYFGVDRLYPEDTSRAKTERRMAGGKALNVTRVLRELGTKTKAFALTAGEAGCQYAHLVRAAGIPSHEVPVRGETRTNVVIFDASDGSERRVSGLGPNAGLNDARRIAHAVLKARPGYVVMNGALPAGMPAAVYAELTEFFSRRGIRVLVDADGDALKKAVKNRFKPFCIKPNEYEFERLTGRPLRTPAAVVSAVRRAASGIPHVIVSLGPHGAVFVHEGEKPFRIRPPRGLVVRSRVAAGDSLVAGFLHALNEGADVREASLFALAAACASTAAPSGVFAKRRLTASFLPRLRIEAI